MGFRLDPTRSLCRQVGTLLVEELDAARRAARNGSEAAHTIRQHGKRSRALLRLVRPALAKKTFSYANHAWRDIGRTLAALRDRQVVADCLDALHERYPDELDTRALVAVRRLLPTIDKAAADEALRQAHLALDALRPRLRHLRCDGGWSAAIAGHLDTVKARRATQRRAMERPSAEKRHAWRKRAKDARYQAHLLARLCPGVLERLERAWDHLGEELGREHDLVMTCDRLAGLHDPGETSAFLRAGRRWLRHQRHRSERAARESLVEPRLLRAVLDQALRTRR